jgi:hypothetical protein
MKEVYVLYGRKHFHEGVFDHDGMYFEESPIIEVFDNFDDAKAKLKEYAIEAYNHLKECGAGSIVDDSFIQETTEADLFAPYYMYPPESHESFTDKTTLDANDKGIAWDTDRERYLYWNYYEYGDFVSWQMYCSNVPWDAEIPILPSLTIKKCVVNTLCKKFVPAESEQK